MNTPMHTFAVAFLFQPVDIKIFNADIVVVVDIEPGEFMQKVISLVVDFSMDLLYLLLDRLSIIRSLLCSGQLSLCL